MTRERPFVKGENGVFSCPDEVRMAYDAEEADLQAKIKVRLIPAEGEEPEIVETTVGRILLSEVIPSSIPFFYVNRVMNKKNVDDLVF